VKIIVTSLAIWLPTTKRIFVTVAVTWDIYFVVLKG